MRLTMNALKEIEWAISDIFGYLTDNSCGDPDCCGGPWYTKEDYEECVEILRSHGITFDPDTLGE